MSIMIGTNMDRDSAWSTRILVMNIHCASCVSYIERVLRNNFATGLHNVETNVISHEVTIRHIRSVSSSDLCNSLSDAAFEVYSAATFDQTGNKVREIGDEGGGNGWLDATTDLWQPFHRASSSRNHLQQTRKSKHMANCDACRRGSEPGQNEDSSMVMLVDPDFESNIAERQTSDTISEVGKPRSLSQSLDPISGPVAEGSLEPVLSIANKATLSIGGMTCASCTSAVDHGLSQLTYVNSVNVTLMTNSAQVVYNGKENLQSIVDAVEDLGYDCAVDHSDSIVSMEKPVLEKGSRRTVMLKIRGMFCKHCPPRVVDSLKTGYGDELHLEQALTLDNPILKITYNPRPPEFTIRNIVATIESNNPSFKASIFMPPTIEQKSQAMQRHEQHRILIRLLLSFVVAIPTLLIGVVWMSLVPSSNGVRQFLEQPVWSGVVSRADWALFILATPVFFLAADVFHVRAIKEIRALWRRNSKVPLLQRFYRFGSMNLLISAGTSTAYFASIAVLGLDATANRQKGIESSTYFDSVVFLTFFILAGRYLEAYSKAKTGNAVGLLGNLRPQEATLLAVSSRELSSGWDLGEIEEKIDVQPCETSTKRIGVDLLEKGDIIMVSHGSSPPADGTILFGFAKFNESSLTGESQAVSKQPGDAIFAGTINVGDPVTVRVTEICGTSMLDQIVNVVREGQTKRAPVERIVDIVTGYFVPIITALAIVTWLIWLTLGYSGALSKRYIGSQQGGWAFWSLEFAIAVFVVACPCGIGLAAPTALFVGCGLAARHGILVRGGGEAFQEASNIDAIVFDKTGTLTEGGDLKVTDHEILAKNEEPLVWSITKSLEETSSHPLARAISEFATGRAGVSIQIVSITEQAGLGLRGTFTIHRPSSTEVDTYEAALGSEALLSSLIPTPETFTYFTHATLSTWKTQSKSIALLALRKTSNHTSTNDPTPWTLAAIFAISDPIRPSAIPTITTLQEGGIPVYMLTGDNPTTASAVASTLSIVQDHVFAGVLPTQKADKIRWLQENAPRRSSNSPVLARLSPFFVRKASAARTSDEEKKPQQKNATIAFIGDGINDAPALTAANVSISLSSASDIALHSSSFILLSPSPSTSPSLLKIPTLLTLSARVFRRVKLNFAWAIVYNAILVPVAAGVFFRVREEGWRLGPVWGSAAMAGSSLCVVGSSVALKWEGGVGWEWIKKRKGR